jgi:hypothetical protein
MTAPDAKTPAVGLRALEVCLMVVAMLRRFVLGAALIVALTGTTPVRAAELVMFESANCIYCKKFRYEAMGPYRRSPAARALPLRIVKMNRHRLWFRLKKPVRSTPTFVIVERGREVERFTGYAGRDRFLSMMNGLVAAYSRYR